MGQKEKGGKICQFIVIFFHMVVRTHIYKNSDCHAHLNTHII